MCQEKETVIVLKATFNNTMLFTSNMTFIIIYLLSPSQVYTVCGSYKRWYM